VSDVARVDAAVLQLRAQLQRLARERSRTSSSSGPAVQPPLDRLREARGAGDAADDDYRRAFVRALLTEELGEGLANQPEFERISNEVWRVLSEDSDTRAMIEEAIIRLG
jgi:hypothetical protein